MLLAALSFRIAAFFVFPGTTSTEMEGFSRLNLARIYEESPSPKYPAVHFGPLPTIVFSWMRSIMQSPVEAPRLLNLLISFAALPLAWRITRQLFGPAAGLFTLGCISGFGIHVLVSVETVSEGMHASLFLAGLLAYLIATNDTSDPRKNRWLIIVSAISLAAASACRFETWPLLIIFPIASLLRRRFKEAAALLIILLIFPAVHMCISHRLEGDALAFLHRASTVAHERSPVGTVPHQIMIAISQLGWSLTWPGILAAITGTILSFRLRKNWLLLALTLVLAFEVLFQSAIGSLSPDIWRYFTLPGLLLSCLSGATVTEIIDYLRSDSKKISNIMIAATVAGMVLGSWGFKNAINKHDEIRTIESHLNQMRQIISTDIDQNDLILVGPEMHAAIAAFIRLPVRQVLCPGIPRVGASEPLSFEKIMLRYKPDKILMYKPDPVFAVDIPLMGNNQEVNLFGASYKNIKQIGVWILWRKVE